MEMKTKHGEVLVAHDEALVIVRWRLFHTAEGEVDVGSSKLIRCEGSRRPKGPRWFWYDLDRRTTHRAHHNIKRDGILLGNGRDGFYLSPRAALRARGEQITWLLGDLNDRMRELEGEARDVALQLPDHVRLPVMIGWHEPRD